ncbi:MAG: hypothetical protein J3R72DRAFT_431860 [Linnemannia gamsii]|nr:MAG: hypothetical protein J3R72DRAFT_431860 [Linnemannia gamsii]
MYVLCFRPAPLFTQSPCSALFSFLLTFVDCAVKKKQPANKEKGCAIEGWYAKIKNKVNAKRTRQIMEIIIINYN